MVLYLYFVFQEVMAMSSASTSAGLPDGKYSCYIKDEQIISIYSEKGMGIHDNMTRFNHNGKTYECNTSDLMDISKPVVDDDKDGGYNKISMTMD